MHTLFNRHLAFFSFLYIVYLYMHTISFIRNSSTHHLLYINIYFCEYSFINAFITFVLLFPSPSFPYLAIQINYLFIHYIH